MRPSTRFVQKRFGNKNLLVAEIGVQRGDNALTLVSALQLEQLYLIDIWQEYRIAGQYGKNDSNANFEIYFPTVVERFGNRSDVTILKLSSLEASHKFSEGYFDFVYIDACHSYGSVKEDILVWFSKVKQGGVLGGHDYSSKIYPGLAQAIDEWVQKNNFKFYQEGLDWWVVK